VDRLDVAQQKLLPPVVQKLRPGALDVAGSLKRLEVREKPGERYGTLTFVFRDDERRTVKLDRKATPMSDPWRFRIGPKP
jgi:hypothetical protein